MQFSHSQQMTQVAQTNQSSKAQENGILRKQFKCSYCDRDGHLIDRCFYLHGFPVGHKLHGKNVKPKGKKLAVHNAQTNTTEPFKGPATEGATFTTKEYNQLMNLLRKGSGNDQSFVNMTGTLTSICDTTQHGVGPLSTLY